MGNLTVQQEQRTLPLLEKIFEKSKDMLSGVELILAQIFQEDRDCYEELIVNQAGLIYQKRYEHIHGFLCFNCNQKGNVEKKKVEPSLAIVKKFELTAVGLENKLKKLTE